MSSQTEKLYQPQAKIHLEADINKLDPYLKKQGWLASDDSISKIQKPGEGNMNFVLRVIPARSRSFIIKQARPWVEKYPHLKAPVERIYVEHRYYQHVNQQLPLARYSPVILGFDQINGVLAMEDLGDAVDFTFVYQVGQDFEQRYLEEAIDYLNRLKKIPAPYDYPTNLELRKLNHEHIFHLPFVQNTFELDQIQSGLQELAEEIRKDHQLIKKIKLLGQVYLSPGNQLLHGDFYPGSLLKSKNGDLQVIDPEFSFTGPEEWDIAVFTAHLFLSQLPIAQIQAVLKLYQSSTDFDHQRFWGFVGTEILRRLLGLAQVPVQLTLKEKTWLIEDACNWIKTGKFNQ